MPTSYDARHGRFVAGREVSSHRVPRIRAHPRYLGSEPTAREAPVYASTPEHRLHLNVPQRAVGPSRCRGCPQTDIDDAPKLVERSVIGVMFSDTVANGDARPTPALI